MSENAPLPRQPWIPTKQDQQRLQAANLAMQAKGWWPFDRLKLARRIYDFLNEDGG
jgi:hypothetical protein